MEIFIAGKHNTNIGLSGSRSRSIKNRITGKKSVAQTQLLTWGVWPVSQSCFCSVHAWKHVDNFNSWFKVLLTWKIPYWILNTFTNSEQSTGKSILTTARGIYWKDDQRRTINTCLKGLSRLLPAKEKTKHFSDYGHW